MRTKPEVDAMRYCFSIQTSKLQGEPTWKYPIGAIEKVFTWYTNICQARTRPAYGRLYIPARGETFHFDVTPNIEQFITNMIEEVKKHRERLIKKTALDYIFSNTISALCWLREDFEAFLVTSTTGQVIAITRP